MTASTRGTYRWRAFVNRSCTSWVVGNHLNIWILRDISRILDVKIRLYIGVFRNFRLHLMARATTGPAHLVMVLVGIRCGFGGGNISIGKLGLLYACFWFILGLFITKIAHLCLFFIQFWPIYYQNCSFPTHAYGSHCWRHVFSRVGKYNLARNCCFSWQYEKCDDWSFFVFFFHPSVKVKVAEKSINCAKLRLKNGGGGNTPLFFHIAMKNTLAHLCFSTLKNPWSEPARRCLR